MSKLMWLFAIPFLASALVFLLASFSAKILKIFSICLSFFPLLILLSSGFQDWMGEKVQFMWFLPLSIELYLKVDALSLLFLYLTCLIIPLTLLAHTHRPFPFSNTFFGFVLLLQGLLIGFFTARDLALFTIFWEAMLFPLYFIMTLWGGVNRQSAALKFLMYMVAGSVLMIAAVLSLFFTSVSLQGTGTFNLDYLGHIASTAPQAIWVCLIFLLAFSVKTPLFPFHAWLPETYYQAPMSGTILLSALLSKAGIYGFLRIGLGLFPTFMEAWSPILLGLAITGALYGGVAAWKQNDFKRLLTYSSFSHVNFVLAGVFIWSQTAHEGAILQALNHGVTIAGLFIVAGWLEERLESTAIGPFSGLARYLPHLCWLTLIFVLASVALPGTNNFVGEFLILFGLFGQHPWLAAVLGLTVILSVIYMLRWMQKVYFETPSAFHHRWVDIKGKEFAIALPLVVLIFLFGIYPAPVLKQIELAVESHRSVAHMEKP